MHQRRVPLRVPTLGRKGADLRCRITSGQESQMRAYGLADRYCVDEEATKRNRMQAPDVIDLEEGVDYQLPVGGASNRVLAIEAMARKPDRIEIAVEIAKVSGDIERAIGGWVEYRPHQTMPHGRRQFPQPERVAIEIGKGLGSGHAGK